MTLRRIPGAPPQRWERSGLLAVEPKAFFEMFFAPLGRATERVGNVDVIEIAGPLVQRDEMWCDSYESIRTRFREACASEAQAIVLRFDSPGGDASGCFETARALRAEALAANKPLYAYVDRCCSAAYALASAATHGIAIGETCCSGSVGVIATRPDVTAMNAAQGLRMGFVTSGTRKLDGNPDVPLSEAELAVTQKHVDDLAAKFFALIGDMRPQLPAATVAGFDGAIFYGDGAVSAGLADSVATFEELLASASVGTNMQAKSDYDSARQSLEKVAKGNDANAAAAKRALAAMAEAAPPEGEPDDEPAAAVPDDEDDDDEPAAAGDAPAPAAAGDAVAPAASSDDEPPADPKKPKGAAAAAATAASSSADVLALAEKVHRLEASAAADKDARTRRKLLASRPDFGPEVRAVLAKVSIKALREACDTWPKGKTPPPSKRTAPITTVGATRADTQVSPNDKGTRSRLSGADADALDRSMGFTTQRLGARREGATMIFGLMDEVNDPDGAA